MALKLYLAGPEVFLPNAQAVLQAKAEMTMRYGFEAICPGDVDIAPKPTKYEFGLEISAVDEDMMNRADGVIANLTPFRGIAADPGTAFELGYMCAQGKIVACYSNVTESHFQRALDYYGGDVADRGDGYRRGPDGTALEDFEMIENLMLHGGVARRGGPIHMHKAGADALLTDLTAFEACLKDLQAKYGV